MTMSCEGCLRFFVFSLPRRLKAAFMGRAGQGRGAGAQGHGGRAGTAPRPRSRRNFAVLTVITF